MGSPCGIDVTRPVLVTLSGQARETRELAMRMLQAEVRAKVAKEKRAKPL